MRQIFHETTCSHCNADLTVKNSVTVHFSVAEHEFDISLEVATNGLLQDRDRLVENGYHAGSLCSSCDWLLEELGETDIPVKRYSWKELLVALAGLSFEDSRQDITVEMHDEFYRCLSFEQVIPGGLGDGILDEGHWFLRVEKV